MKLLIAFALVATVQALPHRGDATAYSGPHDMDATGVNMCEFNARKLDDKWQVDYAAMNEADWDAAGGYDICGKCIKACGAGGCVVAMVVDQCPAWACDRGNVDFSTSALEKATGFSWDRKPIEWDYVDCTEPAAAPVGLGRSIETEIVELASAILDTAAHASDALGSSEAISNLTTTATAKLDEMAASIAPAPAPLP